VAYRGCAEKDSITRVSVCLSTLLSESTDNFSLFCYQKVTTVTTTATAITTSATVLYSFNWLFSQSYLNLGLRKIIFGTAGEYQYVDRCELVIFSQGKQKCAQVGCELFTLYNQLLCCSLL